MGSPARSAAAPLTSSESSWHRLSAEDALAGLASGPEGLATAEAERRLAHLAVLHLPPLQAVFRTRPLTSEDWLLVVAIGFTVIAGGELDKAWNRRRSEPLG